MRIHPQPQAPRHCPDCNAPMSFKRMLYQGIHICAVDHCSECNTEFASDLMMGQAAFTPYQVNLTTGALHGPASGADWFGQPLADALKSPSEQKIHLHYEGDTDGKPRAKILFCLDYIYGHALLKLLNAANELERLQPDEALIVVVQPSLRWLVPNEAHAVWTVELPFGRASQDYYPEFDKAIAAHLSQFEEVGLCPAWSHPQHVDITRFTGLARHDFNAADFRITYIWRGKRGWADRGAVRWAGKALHWHSLAPKAERTRVIEVFEGIRKHLPSARFTVAGFGLEENFPDWIDDQRIEASTPENEKKLCRIYAESRLVIGAHGSNMLLPTAHAGMAITLMSDERWPNLAQDTVLWGDDLDDPRMVVWRYRYLPDTTSASTVATIANSMLRDRHMAAVQFRAEALYSKGKPIQTT